MRSGSIVALLSVPFLMVAVMCSTGCDSDDDGPEPPAVDVSGTWNVSLSGIGNGTVTFVQNGNSIQGNSDQGDQLSGSIEDNNISITVIPPQPGNSLQLDGTASATTMSGTYVGDINGQAVAGTWSAIKQ